MNEKSVLRNHYLKRRNQLTPTEKITQSHALCHSLLHTLKLYSFKVIAAFHPTSNEPNILPVLSEILSTNRLFLPKFKNGTYLLSEVHSLDHDLVKGPYEIMEPRQLSDPTIQPELWLIPGVAFDQNGTRLGYGHGYFDRLLSNQNGQKWGVCFTSQYSLTPLPTERHDIPMDKVFSANNPV